jgi:hypothetical protein
LLRAGGGGGPPDDWDSRAALAAQRAAERGAQLAAARAANLSRCHAALDEVQVVLTNLSAELAELRTLQASPSELHEEPDTLLWHALGVVLTAALTQCGACLAAWRRRDGPPAREPEPLPERRDRRRGGGVLQ